MKQATTGSGSAANPDFPDTAAANADLEARLTGGNTGGAGNAMPNEAQVCMHKRCMLAVVHLERV